MYDHMNNSIYNFLYVWPTHTCRYMLHFAD